MAELRPVNPYGATKLAFESALTWYGAAYGLRSFILRYFNVAGRQPARGEDHRPETHLVPNLMTAVQTGRPMTVMGDDYPTPDGTCVRDYIHVEDLADAHLAALERTAEAAPGVEVCNLGSGTGFSVRQVLDAVAAATGQPVPHVVGARRARRPTDARGLEHAGRRRPGLEAPARHPAGHAGLGLGVARGPPPGLRGGDRLRGLSDRRGEAPRPPRPSRSLTGHTSQRPMSIVPNRVAMASW